jgi:hypothetical protein
MVEFVERSWKNGSRAVPNTPLGCVLTVAVAASAVAVQVKRFFFEFHYISETLTMHAYSSL